MLFTYSSESKKPSDDTTIPVASNPAGLPCGSLGFSLLTKRLLPRLAAEFAEGKFGGQARIARDGLVTRNLSFHRVNLWDSLGGGPDSQPSLGSACKYSLLRIVSVEEFVG